MNIEKPLSVMAKILAYDLLMRERLADNDGEAGPVEEMYRENAQAFLNNIEQSEALQQAAKGMTVKRFRQFMNDAASADGIEKLAEEILEVRGALGAHLHYDNRQLGYPGRWPEPGSEKRGQLEKCLAGLIVEGNIKAVDTGNKNWLKFYAPKNIKTAEDEVRKGAAFQNMMTKLDETLKKEAESKVPVAERTGARICQKACGGDFGELFTMYAMELNAIQQKAQPASKMQQSLQNQAPELSNPNQGSIGKR